MNSVNTKTNVTNIKTPIIMNTPATVKFLQAVQKHQPLMASGLDVIKYLGLTSRSGFTALTKRLEDAGIIIVERNRPLPNSYTLTEDDKTLKKYAYLLKNKLKLSLVD